MLHSMSSDQTSLRNQEKMTTKKVKHEQVKCCLRDILTFLGNYLPLANVHSNEFLTNNVWEEYLPESIRNELLNLSDENLIDLSSYYEKVKATLNSHDDHETVYSVNKDSEISIDPDGKIKDVRTSAGCKNKTDNIEITEYQQNIENSKSENTYNPEDWNFSCPYLEEAPKIKNKSKLVRGFKPNWTHNDLFSFLHDAKMRTIEALNVGCSLMEFYSKLHMSETTDKIFISHIMNMKKSHEVDIMGDVCSLLAKHYGIDKVVDMGSGKGYLSTHLALQHKLLVIAIDAIQTNTAGAQKRADKLTKHWTGLVRNATEDKSRGCKVKRSKKYKKKMKLAAAKGDNSSGTQKKDNLLPEDEGGDIPDFQNLFDSIEKIDDKNPHLESNSEDIDEKESFTNVVDCGNHSEDDNALDIKVMETKLPIPLESYTQNTLLQQEMKSLTLDDKTSDCIECTDFNVTNSNSMDSKTGLNTSKSSSADKAKCKVLDDLLFPLTMYVSSTMNLEEVVDIALEGNRQNGSRDMGLMLTGLHTCGGLGSSILQLFVNNPEARVLCCVGCCYHLMEEEFVCAPFDDGEGDSLETPGFPLSKFLRDQRVGLGRIARNFASQSVNRMSQGTELKSKAFPRSLLQKIIVDIVGYVREDWKGIRKLDQKCKDMYEYVNKAFCKFGLPTDRLTPELVEEYVEKYKGEERKLAAFHNLKTMIASCIEAVVILDRICYLLEQECVEDVYLVQLFDPVTSPRCYGIIAYKNNYTDTLKV